MSYSTSKPKKAGTLNAYFKPAVRNNNNNNNNDNNNRSLSSSWRSISPLSNTQTQQQKSSATIDLTDNNSDDDDLIILDDIPKNAYRGSRANNSNSNSQQESFGSQGIQTQELSSTSKFRKEPSYNLDQRQKPFFSSYTFQTSHTTTSTFGVRGMSSSTTNDSYKNNSSNRVVPVERKVSQPSGMSLTDRLGSNVSHPIQGAGMVSSSSFGWKKTVDTSSSSSSSTTTTSGTKRGYSSITSSSSSSSAGWVSSTSTNKKKRELPATFITSASALGALNGKATKERTIGGFKSVTSSSSNKKSYGSNMSFYGNNNNTNNNNNRYSSNKRKNNNKSSYRPKLSAEQQKVFDIVVNERRSIFFTGSAGTGKSVLLRAIIDSLREKYPDGVAITAPTGIAACNINGSTIHSFAGIGLGQDPPMKLVQKVQSNKKASERWRRTRVLIIDEISMVDAELFDKIELIARTMKASQKPFGDIQLIVTGDFFQLPPVSRYGMARFAFESKCWSKVINKTIMLKQVFRQKDSEFVDILNEMRLGRLSEAAIQKFRSLSRTPQTYNMIEPTELYALRDQVDKSNTARLNGLPGDIRTFKAHDTGDKAKVEGCIAPEAVHLKKDAQVMLLKNMDQTLVNGSLGIVVGFVGDEKYNTLTDIRRCMPPSKFSGAQSSEIEPDLESMKSQQWPIVQFTDGREVLMESEQWSIELPGGEVVASRTQIPLMLAWAMSIHKSQGQTLESVRVDLGKVFEKGQAYVALSRATSLEGLQILNFDESKVMAHERVATFYQNLDTV
ncbi:hypothetical protein INT45_013115 [Circinella minor]|uniref:ATP-dependent DNA helicase PIF1 n=1 Tax=Circinella minor TaxID=1195481 RepID=A0A8H7S720_9FUNG|nr:hypothetical protein INT45_013115 [Circinella minor]